jgi:hypothetical protein
VAVNSGQVAFSDTENNRVQIVTAGTMNTAGGTPSNGAETLTLGAITTTVYGSGSLTATLSDQGKTATGLVTLYDGEGSSPVMVGSAPLVSNQATIGAGALAVGAHDLIASYAGDANNAAITSGVYILAVTPLQVTATPNAVSLLYGQAIPTLTGTLAGMLSRDSANVTAVYSTTATSSSNPGVYPIAAALSGSEAGNYTVVLGAGSGSVTIAQSPTATQLQLSTAKPVYEAALTLTATVTAASGATPAGTVSFYNGTTLLNNTPATLTGGVATLNTSSLPVGALSLTAVYSGNIDFVGSTSPQVDIGNISPDFTIAASPAAQTVIPNQSVQYTLTLTPVNPTFVYPVSLSVDGLPSGVTAVFSPSSIAAGAAQAQVTLTLSASATARLESAPRVLHSLPLPAALALLPLPFLFNRRFRRRCAGIFGRWMMLFLLALATAGAVCGCGGGFFGHKTQSYTVTVTAVSGPNTHSSAVTLTVQ